MIESVVLVFLKTDFKIIQFIYRRMAILMPQILRSSSGRSLWSNIRLLHLVSNDRSRITNGKHTLDIPPSTTKSLPLTKLLSSLAKNTTA